MIIDFIKKFFIKNKEINIDVMPTKGVLYSKDDLHIVVNKINRKDKKYILQNINTEDFKIVNAILNKYIICYKIVNGKNHFIDTSFLYMNDYFHIVYELLYFNFGDKLYLEITPADENHYIKEKDVLFIPYTDIKHLSFKRLTNPLLSNGVNFYLKPISFYAKLYECAEKYHLNDDVYDMIYLLDNKDDITIDELYDMISIYYDIDIDVRYNVSKIARNINLLFMMKKIMYNDKEYYITKVSIL